MISLPLLALLGYNVYFANLHSHTSYSDGQGLPAEAFQYARDTARIDVLALTDHTHYMTPGQYAQQRQIAAQFCEEGRFVALAGQEFGSLAQFGHFTIYDADSLCPVSVSDLNGFYSWLARVREPAQFNHPSLANFNAFTYHRVADSFATTLEVVNGSGMYAPVNESLYFEALRRGWHCAPVANQDNHRRRWGDAAAPTGEVPLTGILADTLTRDAILEAIMQRRVYAFTARPVSDRIFLHQFTIGAAPLGSRLISFDSTVRMVIQVSATTDFRQLYLYRDGIVVDSAAHGSDTTVASLDTNSVSWTATVPIHNGYYLVKGVQEDGDNFWTAPIWVNYQALAHTLEFWPNPLVTGTRIIFPGEGQRIEVFDATGRPVYQSPSTGMLNRLVSPYEWNGLGNSGEPLPNGIYYVQVTTVTNQGRTAAYTGKLAIKR